MHDRQQATQHKKLPTLFVAVRAGHFWSPCSAEGNEEEIQCSSWERQTEAW